VATALLYSAIHQFKEIAMSSNYSPCPLPFEPDFEVASDDEEQTSREIVAAMHRILETTYQHYGHAVRCVHAKSHGLLQGEMEVCAGLSAEHAQGIFANEGVFPVMMRFSTNPGDLLEDSVSTPRGLAVKVLGVRGTRLLDTAGAATQDFVMLDAPTFASADPKSFLRVLKLLAPTTDRSPEAKKILSAVLRGAEHVLETFGHESNALKGLGGHPKTHILGETFYTCSPILYGKHFAKICVVPSSPELMALTNAQLGTSGKPNALREAVVEFFNEYGGEWDVRAQLATNLETMPVEDPSVRWPEEESPYVSVARIKVSPQRAWTYSRAAAVDDAMAFSPWHCIEAHRPLGGIMRVRRPSYEMSAQFRGEHNGSEIREPAATAILPK
jgi:hypothetical protein